MVTVAESGSADGPPGEQPRKPGRKAFGAMFSVFLVQATRLTRDHNNHYTDPGSDVLLNRAVRRSKFSKASRIQVGNNKPSRKTSVLTLNESHDLRHLAVHLTLFDRPD